MPTKYTTIICLLTSHYVNFHEHGSGIEVMERIVGGNMADQEMAKSDGKDSSEITEEEYSARLKELEESRNIVLGKIQHIYNEVLCLNIKDRRHLLETLAKEKQACQKHDDEEKGKEHKQTPSPCIKEKRIKKHESHSQNLKERVKGLPSKSNEEQHQSLQHCPIHSASNFHSVLWKCTNDCNLECVYCILACMSDIGAFSDGISNNNGTTSTKHRRIHKHKGSQRAEVQSPMRKKRNDKHDGEIAQYDKGNGHTAPKSIVKVRKHHRGDARHKDGNCNSEPVSKSDVKSGSTSPESFVEEVKLGESNSSHKSSKKHSDFVQRNGDIINNDEAICPNSPKTLIEEQKFNEDLKYSYEHSSSSQQVSMDDNVNCASDCISISVNESMAVDNECAPVNPSENDKVASVRSSVSSTRESSKKRLTVDVKCDYMTGASALLKHSEQNSEIPKNTKESESCGSDTYVVASNKSVDDASEKISENTYQIMSDGQTASIVNKEPFQPSRSVFASETSSDQNHPTGKEAEPPLQSTLNAKLWKDSTVKGDVHCTLLESMLIEVNGSSKQEPGHKQKSQNVPLGLGNSYPKVRPRKELKVLSVTIPQPFHLQLGEKEKRWKGCTENIIHNIWRESAAKTHQRLHTNPIPGHTFLPLYQKMVEENAEKERTRKEKLIERHRELSQPFTFATDQRQFERRRCVSASNIYQDPQDCSTQFKANPVHHEIIGPESQLRFTVEEELRKMRIHLRAKEVLKESTLPFTSKQWKFKHCCSSQCKGRLSENIPHQDCGTDSKEKGAASKSSNKRSDRHVGIHSFIFKTAELPTRAKCLKHSKGQEVPTRSTTSACRSASAPPSPIRMTVATQLRAKLIQDKMLADKRNSLRFAMQEKERRSRQRDLHKDFLWRIDNSTLCSQKAIQMKLRNLRQSASQREREYQKELRDIKERVKRQPLLMERQIMEAAKQLVERRYRDKLRRFGLDINHIIEKSQKCLASDQGNTECDDSYHPLTSEENQLDEMTGTRTSESNNQTESEPSINEDDDRDEGSGQEESEQEQEQDEIIGDEGDRED